MLFGSFGQYSIYLGGAPSMDSERIKLWRQAFESLRRDGQYASILQSYHYAIPTTPR